LLGSTRSVTVHVEKIHIDRFGALSGVEIGSLTGFLNVFYDPTGWGAESVSRFLQGMLHGFHQEASPHDHRLNSRRVGGTLTLATPQGGQVIRRFAGDGTGERLTVPHNAGRILGCRDLRELFDISGRTHDRLFSVDLHQRPRIDDLAREARICEMELGERPVDQEEFQECRASLQQHRERLAVLPNIAEPRDALQHRAGVLRDEITALSSRDAEFRADRARRLDAVKKQATDVERQLAALKQDLQTTTQSIELLESQKSQQRPVIPAPEETPDVADLHRQLNQSELRIERWRSVLQDIAQRKQALQKDVEDLGDLPEGDTADVVEPRTFLRSIESHISHLLTCVADLQTDTADPTCRCRTMRDVLSPELVEMRDDVYRLCQEMSRAGLLAGRRECSDELAQLERCDLELRAAIHR